tara:strand:- start:216 stop:542 length:327 start_codon:yes stop_codon:yes gene_type:complete
MAIEKCPECEDQVLDNNYSCPACGFVKSDKPEQQKHPEKEITSANTSKGLQIQGIIAFILAVAGLLWFYLSGDAYAQRNEVNVVALIMFVAGFVWYMWIRIRIWREHD